ncbi:hypothetical protein SADUNF_Sadunf08G0063500 [Salix dunnii]|uniref:Uncharacterized protein n=1 Tax=Salix dunnii TaxID=1413687 RepID=A0A835MS88_9ROSI|nr:hypothetical protein SADUNF_Sadunf08G0063500 [Salix dunnii]
MRPDRWLIERPRVSESFRSPIIPDIFPVNCFQDNFKVTKQERFVNSFWNLSLKVIALDIYQVRKTKRLLVFKLSSLHNQLHLLHVKGVVR